MTPSPRRTPLLALICLLVSAWAWTAEEALWIDVRTPDEFAEGHVPGAVNLPVDSVVEQISAVAADKSTPIYLYCRSGGRAERARTALQTAGYTQVVNIGGLEQALEAAE